MKSDYIDLVVAQLEDGRKVLLTAPAWSDLNEGDTVKFSDLDGDLVTVNVICKLTTASNMREDDAKVLLKIFDVRGDIDRIVCKVVERKFDYKDYDESPFGGEDK